MNYKNLIIFGSLATAYAASFFISLEWALRAQRYNFIWLFAVLYGLAMLLTGKLLGTKDDQKNKAYEMDFWYHLTTFVITNAIAIIYLLFLHRENLLYQLIGTISWSIGLAVHYRVSRKSIRGYEKEEVFK